MYVCTEFASDGVTCTNWVALQQGVLPPLSLEDGAAIGASAMLVFAVAWAYRLLKRAA